MFGYREEEGGKNRLVQARVSSLGGLIPSNNFTTQFRQFIHRPWIKHGPTFAFQ